jgi:hypothetical protein
LNIDKDKNANSKKNNTRGKVNRNYKDGVFKLLFKERERAAELYYALTGIKCQPEEIEVITLEDALSKNFVNDLAIVVNGQALLISEHQSSWNENMPLRIVIYLGRLYEKYLGLESNKHFLHRRSLSKIPTPKFVVLYNGDEELPKDCLKLSDAFEQKAVKGLGTLELTVPVIDINKEKNSEILKKSEILNQYSDFIATTKKYIKDMSNLREALEAAIKDCKARGILVEFLTENGGDIVSILEMDWNIDDALEVRYEEGLEKGIEKTILTIHKKGKSNKEISDLLDISEKEIEKIIKRNTRVRA